VALRFDGTLSIFNGQRWREQHVEGHWQGEPPLLAALPDGKTILFCDENSSAIQYWNLEEERLIRNIPESLSPAADCSPDRKMVAFGRGDGRVSIIELETGKDRLLQVGHRLNITNIRFSPDSRTLVSASDDGTVRLWHVPTGQELFVLEDRGGKRISSMAFSADGRFLAVGGFPNEHVCSITVYDARSPDDAAHADLEQP
jgi:WD40 repeat protein